MNIPAENVDFVLMMPMILDQGTLSFPITELVYNTLNYVHMGHCMPILSD